MSRFTLRLPETLHNELETRARQEGVSLNQYIVYALTKQVSPVYTVQMVSKENIREQQEQFQEFQKSLGETSKAEAQAWLLEREASRPEEDLTAEIIYRVKAKIVAAETYEQLS
ncbi:MAG: toxin-antitoxin system HicB family antitoxin [Anaerolineae bacterium]|nr:toxin-antitoxin system HicB family antitoxin [Anaerolineae bacterium]